MAEVNPYQQPSSDEDASRPKRRYELVASAVPRESLRVVLGLVALLAATLGFVVSSAALGVIDRFVPISWFLFTPGVVKGLILVFLVAAAALAWLSWTLQKKGYPRRRLTLVAAAGWAFGLLCLVGVVRADTASEERAAEAICAPLAARSGAAGTGQEDPAERCEAAFLACRRSLRRLPGYAELTYDAERSMMNACMERSGGLPR